MIWFLCGGGGQRIYVRRVRNVCSWSIVIICPAGGRQVRSMDPAGPVPVPYVPSHPSDHASSSRTHMLDENSEKLLLSLSSQLGVSGRLLVLHRRAS